MYNHIKITIKIKEDIKKTYISIADEISKLGVEVDKKKVELNDNIKNVGKYNVKVKLRVYTGDSYKNYYANVDENGSITESETRTGTWAWWTAQAPSPPVFSYPWKRY